MSLDLLSYNANRLISCSLLLSLAYYKPKLTDLTKSSQPTKVSADLQIALFVFSLFFFFFFPFFSPYECDGTARDTIMDCCSSMLLQGSLSSSKDPCKLV